MSIHVNAWLDLINTEGQKSRIITQNTTFLNQKKIYKYFDTKSIYTHFPLQRRMKKLTNFTKTRVGWIERNSVCTFAHLDQYNIVQKWVKLEILQDGI